MSSVTRVPLPNIHETCRVVKEKVARLSLGMKEKPTAYQLGQLRLFIIFNKSKN